MSQSRTPSLPFTLRPAALPSLAIISSRPFPSPYANRPKGKDLPCPDPEHLSKNSGWFLDVYASPDVPFSSDRSGLSYTAGVRSGKIFNNGFSATIGLEYSRLSLQRKYDSLTYSWANTYNNFDLPALIGYQLGAPGLNATINAGLVWNIHSQPAANSRSYYRTSTGLSLYTGLVLLKTINSRLSLFAEPRMRYQLSNRTFGYLQSPDIGELSLGIRYNFTKPVGLK